jgi:Tripartite tricarboxylate transporter family receptor
MERLAFALVLTAASMLAAAPLAADDYPSRPIRFLQGFASGGNADVVTRVLGEELAKGLGQPVVSESRPGAGGNLASAEKGRARRPHHRAADDGACHFGGALQVAPEMVSERRQHHAEGELLRPDGGDHLSAHR